MFAGGIAVRKTDGKCDPTHARLPADPVFATPPPLPPSPFPMRGRRPLKGREKPRDKRPGPQRPVRLLSGARVGGPAARARRAQGDALRPICGYYLCPPLCPSFPPRSPTNPRCLPRFLIDLAFVAPSPRAVAPPLTIAPQLLPRLLFHLSRMGIGYWGEHCQISSTLFKLRLSRHIRSELSYRHERSADTLYHSSASARTLCCSAALLQRKDRQRRRA